MLGLQFVFRTFTRYTSNRVGDKILDNLKIHHKNVQKLWTTINLSFQSFAAVFCLIQS